MTRSMTALRARTRVPVGAMLLVIILSLGAVGGAAAKGLPTFDPMDSRLTPNPVENSDAATVWSCQVTGSVVACDGTLRNTWELQEGPDDWCVVPLFSVHGLFSRTQTRYFAFDPATALYLEYKRLIHLDATEYFTPDPDPNATNVVYARLSMTWMTAFETPGDLDLRSTRKQGIDTLWKRPDGGAFVLDVGQTTEDLTIAPGEDFDIRGRWDHVRGDPAVVFGEVCTALGI